MVKFSVDDILKLFFLFFPENRIWHYMQIVSTICMKCQILFSGRNKKNITIFSAAELAQSLVKVNSLKH